MISKTYSFFQQPLSEVDPEIDHFLHDELMRQQEHIELIASENLVSKAVLDAIGSVLTNKYAEGYAGRRYYHGCECVDEVEKLAIERAKKLFHADYANVQPHSGSQANQGVFLALLQSGDTLMGMGLDAGGHLTHGSKVSSSGKYYRAISYGVDSQTGLIDYDHLEAQVLEARPRLIIAGGSAYARRLDLKRFREIASRVGAYLMVDMAHFAGLVAAGLLDNPIDYADVVTTTTHKTLRGARGGLVLTNDPEIAKKINSAIFPGLQGGPLMHIIAGKAVALGEALRPEFKEYAQNVMKNAKVLEDVFRRRGIEMVSGGTDTHLLLLDLRNKGITGAETCDALSLSRLICNKNSVPNDPQKPTITSGLRVGTPAGTTRGFGEEEFRQIGNMISDVIDACVVGNPAKKEEVIKKTSEAALELCHRFSIYQKSHGE